MRRFTLLFFSMLLSLSVLAGPVGQKLARRVAAQFYSSLTGKKSVKFDKELTYKYDGHKTMYIFTIKDGGFVITSTDDNIKPIIAYSAQNDFPLPIQSPEVKWWLNIYSSQIDYVLDNNVTLTKNQDLWTKYSNGEIQHPKQQVGPLVHTEWNQSGGDDTYPYNYFCPGGAPVGCVATATSQVMKYWEYPKTGRGWHTYVHPQYGRLSATFDTINFDWAKMPLTSSSFYVALLSYSVGVAIDMDYETTGSGAYTFDLTYALTNYFKYSDDIMYYSRSTIEKYYGKQAWIDTLKNQLDMGYPMVYAGYGDQGGHAFVCDGYNDQDQFHFNWGWAGSYDGWFDLDKLNPGNDDFSQSQSALINIHPPKQVPSFIAVKSQSPFVHNQKTNEVMRYIDAVDDNIAYAVPNTSAGIGKTKTGGAVWEFIPLPSDYSNYGVSMIDAINKDTLFIPIFSNGIGNTYLLRSTDGGQTWEKVLEGAKAGTSFFNVVHFFDPKHGIVEGDPVNGEFEIYTTDDGGQTWTQVDASEIPDALKGEYGTVGYFYGDNNNIWFFTTKGRVFRSKDMGKTWDVTPLKTPADIGDPEGNDRADLAGAVLKNGTGSIVETYAEFTSNDTLYHRYYYYTTDFGDTWTQYTPNDSITAEQIRTVPGENILIAVGNGIHYSSDGINWSSFPQFYNLFYINAIDLVSDDYGYMGSPKWGFANGAWIFGYNDKAIPDFKSSVQRACQGSQVQFSDASLGLVNSLTWNFGAGANPPTATGPGPHNVTYTTAGQKTITLTITDANGNQSSIQKQFTVDGQIPDYIAQIQGEKIPLINKSYTYSVKDQGDKYKWDFPTIWTVKTDKDTSVQKVTIKGSLGQKEIHVTPYNGCGEGETSSLIVTVVGGIDNPYPNPSSDYVYIEKTQDCNIYVYNNSGKLVQKINNASYLTILNVADSKYQSGIYTVVIVNKDGKKRMVKVLVVK